MTLPNFIVIGAGKAGTTSLHQYLSAHSDVFMCRPKEPRFLAYADAPANFQGPRDDRLFCPATQAEYEALFEGAGDAKAIGEASTWYLTHPDAAANMARLVPNAKLIAVLRNPVERSFSHWMHLIREQIEPLEDFEAACAAEAERIDANWSPHWHYVRQSRYGEGLARFLEHFERSQIKVFLYEDLLADPVAVSQSIYQFLGVRSDFAPDTAARLNVGGAPRFKALQRYLDNSLWGGDDPLKLVKKVIPAGVKKNVKKNLTEMNLSRDITLTDDARARLYTRLADDIDHLERLIERDLAAWRPQGAATESAPNANAASLA